MNVEEPNEKVCSRKMKVFVLHGIGDLREEEREIPTPAAGEALVRVLACGICGSDVPRVYETGAHRHPLIPGHEFSGCVESVGEGTDPGLVGKRVGIFPLIPCGKCSACRAGRYELCSSYDYLGSRRDGGFAEYVCVPAHRLVPLPDRITDEQAAMLEPMGVALHAIRRGGLLTGPADAGATRPENALVPPANASEYEKQNPATQVSTEELKIAVLGLGTIGMLAVMLLKDAGYREVYAIGTRSAQQNRARSFGIDDAHYLDARALGTDRLITELERRTDGGADLVLECVGTSEAAQQAVLAAAPLGTVVLVGNPHGTMELPRETYWRILRRQLTLTGTWNASFTGGAEDDWSYLLERLSDGMDSSALITHRLPLAQLPYGLELMRDKSEDYCKVMLQICSNKATKEC